MQIYSIGHSHHSFSHFYNLLENNGIKIVVDVRSIPYSRHFPVYRKKNLESELKGKGFGYVFLGRELGGKRKEDRFLTPDGKTDYERIKGLSSFKQGIEDVIKLGQENLKPALMCAEKDPRRCHRFLLLGNYLARKGLWISHIFEDGSLRGQKELEKEMVEKYCPPSLFSDCQLPPPVEAGACKSSS